MVSTADITNQYPNLRVLIKTDSHSQSTQIGPWLPLFRDLSPSYAMIVKKYVTLRQALFLLFSSSLNSLFKSVPLLCHLPSPTKTPGEVLMAQASLRWCLLPWSSSTEPRVASVWEPPAPSVTRPDGVEGPWSREAPMAADGPGAPQGLCQYSPSSPGLGNLQESLYEGYWGWL